MAEDLQPAVFGVGDLVEDVDRPQWGRGTVVADRTAARSPTSGQRLHVDFERRGLVMVYTAQRVLRRVGT